MNILTESLAINYLGVKETTEIDSQIKHQFDRLTRVYSEIQTCKVKIADLAANLAKKPGHAYLTSITLSLTYGVELYVLRSPLSVNDSIEVAIADVFAKMYRQLIELQVEEKYLSTI